MGGFFVVMTLAIVAAFAEDVTVTTDVGTFVGFTGEIDVEGTPFRLAKFLGIPYAEAPVGDLRFRKPVPKSPLSDPREAKKFGSPCMQVMGMPKPLKGSEDCLFLNVFTPEASLVNTEKIPVMVWIHGGGFLMGSANAYVPDRLIANGPVIVVTINYRLSIWGFLSSGDSNSRGNYGLWDQHLAIKWVHDNIDKFGGDPNRATIFGESAGSMSVIFQGLYPGNVGLFKGIIGQSGSPIAKWLVARDPLQETREFASLTGCENEDIERMVECLRKIDNDVINGTLNDVSNGFTYKPVFLPFRDGEFLENDPIHLLEDQNSVAASRKAFSSFNLMTGVTSGEGYLFTPPAPFQMEAWEMFLPNSSFFKETLVPQMAHMFLGGSSPLLAQAIAAEFTDWDDPENPEKIREKYIDIAGDLVFMAPLCLTIDLHASITSRPSSYMYYFTAMPANHALPTPSWATRPNHGDDIIYVFSGEGDLSEFDIDELPPLEDWEKKLANDMMTMWTNFAKTGNPNKPRDLGIDWLPYTGSHQHYLDISRTLTSQNVKTRLEGRRVNFWNKIVPSIIKSCKDKSSNTEGTCEKDGGCSP